MPFITTSCRFSNIEFYDIPLNFLIYGTMMSVMDGLFFQGTFRISENVALQGSCQSFSVALSSYIVHNSVCLTF